MAPIDHSVEGRRAYDSRRSMGGWPPAALQLDLGKIARKTVSGTTKTLQRFRRKSKEPEPVTKQNSEQRTRRPLTSDGFVDDGHDASPTTSDQSQSILFKLPIELRQKIYRLVLADSNVHIKTIRGGKAHRHLRCKCDTCPGTAFFSEHSTYSWKQNWTCDKTKYTLDGDRLLVQLLRTCRRIYSESIDLLYSDNTFTFRDPVVLHSFLHHLLPQRRASIKTVHLDFNLASFLPKPDGSFSAAPYAAKVWEEAWDSLLGLDGLDSMEIRVHYKGVSPSPPPSSAYSSFLEPVSEVKTIVTLRKVVLYLPEGVAPDNWMNEAPFETRPLTRWRWWETHEYPRKLEVFVA